MYNGLNDMTNIPESSLYNPTQRKPNNMFADKASLSLPLSLSSISPSLSLSLSFSLSLSPYTYTHTYIYICVHIYIYVCVWCVFIHVFSWIVELRSL